MLKVYFIMISIVELLEFVVCLVFVVYVGGFYLGFCNLGDN